MKWVQWAFVLCWCCHVSQQTPHIACVSGPQEKIPCGGIRTGFSNTMESKSSGVVGWPEAIFQHEELCIAWLNTKWRPVYIARLYLPSTWMEPGTMLTLKVLLGLERALTKTPGTSSGVGSCASGTELLNWSNTSATVLFLLPLLGAELHPKKAHFSVNTHTSCKCTIVPSYH